MARTAGREYELASKILLISVSFLTISITFGYYWLLIKNHSESTSGIIKHTFESYYNTDAGNGENINEEIRFKNISHTLASSGRPFMVVNVAGGTEMPVIWNNLPAKNNISKSLRMFKESKTPPIVLKGDFYDRFLYYTPDDLINKIRFYPLFMLLTMFLLIFVTFYLLMFMRKNEKQSLWIAMTKETAHQLGTPLTSLKGWSDYISGLNDKDQDMLLIGEGLKDDIERIDLIVSRFSKISAPRDYGMCRLKDILEKTVSYISKRITVDTEKIVVLTELEDIPDIYANPVLLEWSFENILKNAIESLGESKKGEIVIRLFSEKNKAVTEISDNGSGVPAFNRKNIFKTGFTTKKRGWGLGLSLAKKVVEQYHKGSLTLKHTSDEGSVFRVELDKYI